MRGGSIGALQKIIGQKNVSMTFRYAHLSKEFARNEIERLSDLTDDVNKMSAGQVTSDAQGAKDNANLLKSSVRKTGFEPATLSVTH